MKWTIVESSIPGAMGAGPNQHVAEEAVKAYRLESSETGAYAIIHASADVTPKDFAEWARNAHKLDSIQETKFVPKEPAKADDPLANLTAQFAEAMKNQADAQAAQHAETAALIKSTAEAHAAQVNELKALVNEQGKKIETLSKKS